jgi:hypothetical protein
MNHLFADNEAVLLGNCSSVFFFFLKKWSAHLREVGSEQLSPLFINSVDVFGSGVL